MKDKLLPLIIIATILFGVQTFAVGQAEAVEKKDENVKQEWWWNKDKKEKKIPELRGGSESSKRQQEDDPISLDILQQRYPDAVFLRGPATENRVAITFDDGPDPRFTPGVLDALNEYNVPATFFLMGARAEEYPNISKRIVEEGHVVGNHTFWHPDLVEEGEISTLVREVTQTEETLADIIGYKTTLFRPPYGFLHDELVEELIDLNYSVIGWSIDSLDWEESPSEEIASNVLDNIHPGAIILMHDGAEADGDRTQTIEALHEIIPALQEQGMEFVTVPELLNIPYQR